MDGSIGKDRQRSVPAATRRAPGHLLVDPDQQEPSLPKRCVVAGPVRRLIAARTWFAHAARVTAWIREVSPPM
jgi:hypothetical protein